MKNYNLSFSLLVLLLLAAFSLQAQNPEKPYILTVTVNGVAVDATKIIDLSSGANAQLTFSANPNFEGLQYVVKSITISTIGQPGASKTIATIPVTSNNGVNTYAFGTTSTPGKLQYTLEGIQMEKNGKKKRANIPLRDRTVIVRHL